MVVVLWLIFLFFSIGALDTSARKPEIKKYTCCPSQFGFLGFLDAAPSFTERWMPKELKDIYLCTASDTADCDDRDYKIIISQKIFMRLILEASKAHTLESQLALATLLGKIHTKKVTLTSTQIADLKITQKDLVHRLLAHIPAQQDISFWDGSRVWNLVTDYGKISIDFKVCIHAIKNVTCSWYATDDTDLFGPHLITEFYTLLNGNIPSLKEIAAHVVAKNCATKENLENLKSKLPQEVFEIVNAAFNN